VCPTCLDIQATHFAVEQLRCRNGHSFTKKGAVSGAHLTCSNGHQHSLIASLAGQAPEHDLYAKLVLGRDGSKSYESVDQFDLDLYQEANELLDKKRDLLVLPRGELKDGYNTRQALRWGYRNWLDFFNARQLYCLGLLGAAIRELAATPNEREALAALFSGTLEFNNLFCSFKGEGTGAVRHMFSHHVLKPERTPLEAHPWGTPASSGSFSTLFRSRLIRAHEYKQSPHDQVLVGDTVRRQRGSSTSIALDLVTRWPTSGLKVGQAYVRSGDSSHTDLPTASIDLIITDPPFMDNVHYSELADFFHAWLRALDPFDGYPSTVTSTRSQGEVQATDPTDFCNAITGVWRECFRVLKPTGLLAFTFHHSRTAGWVAVMRALNEANFVVTELQPVKAEMSSSVTKGGAAEPSNLDSIIVCRPRATARPYVSTTDEARVRSASLLAALLRGGVTVGIGDARSVVRGSVLSLLTNSPDEVDEDKLSVLADEIADEVISCLGLSPSRNLLMEDRLR
jgi:adenine-specific DNA methylase